MSKHVWFAISLLVGLVDLLGSAGTVDILLLIFGLGEKKNESMGRLH